MGALLLALFVGVFSATPFGERNVAYAQTHDDDTLSSLSISGVSISPAFNRTTKVYYARVPNATTSVRVTANTNNPKASVVVGAGNTASTRTSTETITTAEGASTITITVTTEGGTESTAPYTINVYRVTGTPSGDSTLTAWALFDISANGTVDTTSRLPSTVATTAEAQVAHNIAKVRLTATGPTGAIVHIGNIRYNVSTPTDGGHAIDLNGKGSKTTIRFNVTPEDGSSGTTYTITVYREREVKSGDDKLTSLSLGSGITLMPPFDPNETDYTARVRNAVDDGKVSFTLSDNAGGVRDAVTAFDHGVDGTIGTTSIITDTDTNDFRLTAGRKNTITVKVAAEDVSTTDIADDALAGTACTATNIRCYTVVVYRENLTKLSTKTLATTGLTVVGNDAATTNVLSPTFAPDRFEYMNNAVSNDISQVTVTATPADASGGATYVIDPPDAVSGGTHQVNLAAGQMTTITVTVTAENGDMQTYTVKLYRQRSANQLSDDDRLKSLTVTDASGAEQTLDPAFDPAKTMYNVRVANGVSQITITPETFEYGARFTYSDGANAAIPDANDPLDGHQVNSPDPAATDAAARKTTIIVKVAAEDAIADDATLAGTACTATTIKCYTIVVYRENAKLSNDAKLAAADATPAGLILTPAGAMTPDPFDPDTTDYRVVVGNGVPSVTVTANPAHAGAMVDTMPSDEDSGTPGHQVIATVGAEKEIMVTVTAEDGTTMKTYKIILYRERVPKSSDATLSALSFDNATLSPDFSPTTMTYTATAQFSDSEFTTLTYAVDPGAKMVEVMSGRAGSLGEVTETRRGATARLYNTGETVITIKVFAENSTGTGDTATNTKTYTITVSRASEPSSDATLSSLSLKHLPMNKMEGESIDLSPMFDSGTMAYSADAGDEEMITVTAKAMHSAAMVSSVTVNGTAAMMTDIPTYWDMLGCPAMNDSVRMYDDHNHPDSPASPYCTTYHMDATHPGLMGDAKAVVDMTFADYYDVPLMMGDNTISVMVTAEDGMTTETYTVTVTRGEPGPTPGMTLLERYDANDNDMIDREEAVQAVIDFQMGDLSLADAVQVILLYQGS